MRIRKYTDKPVRVFYCFFFSCFLLLLFRYIFSKNPSQELRVEFFISGSGRNSRGMSTSASIIFLFSKVLSSLLLINFGWVCRPFVLIELIFTLKTRDATCNDVKMLKCWTRGKYQIYSSSLMSNIYHYLSKCNEILC